MGFSQTKTETFDFNNTRTVLSGVIDLGEQGVLVFFANDRTDVILKSDLDVKFYSKEMDLKWEAHLDKKNSGIGALGMISAKATDKYIYIYSYGGGGLHITQFNMKGAFKHIEIESTKEDYLYVGIGRRKEDPFPYGLVEANDRIFIRQTKQRASRKEDRTVYFQELDQDLMILIGSPVKMNLPSINREIFDLINSRWLYGGSKEDRHYFYYKYVTVTKRRVENSIKYVIAVVNSKGDLIDNFSIPVKLEGGMHVAGMRYPILLYTMKSSPLPAIKPSNLTDIIFDQDRDYIYIYGVFFNEPAGATKNKSEGLFIHKYNLKSDSIWKTQVLYPTVFKDSYKWFGRYNDLWGAVEFIPNPHINTILFRYRYLGAAKSVVFNLTLDSSGKLLNSNNTKDRRLHSTKYKRDDYGSLIYCIKRLPFYTNKEIINNSATNLLPGSAFNKMYELNKGDNPKARIFYITKHSSSGDIVIENRISDRKVNMYYLPAYN